MFQQCLIRIIEIYTFLMRVRCRWHQPALQNNNRTDWLETAFSWQARWGQTNIAWMRQPRETRFQRHVVKVWRRGSGYVEDSARGGWRSLRSKPRHEIAFRGGALKSTADSCTRRLSWSSCRAELSPRLASAHKKDGGFLTELVGVIRRSGASDSTHFIHPNR